MDDSANNNNKDSSFLETKEFQTPDDGHFQQNHVMNKLLTVLSDFNELFHEGLVLHAKNCASASDLQQDAGI